MKRLSLIVCISMMVILGFAAFAWAQEASVVDNVEKVVIRAYLLGTSPNISAYLEVRNSDGTFQTTPDYDATKIVVTDIADPAHPQTLTKVGGISPQQNAYRIHTNDLTSSDISISIDETDGTVYVFCIKDPSPGWHVMKYNIQNLALIGACGASGPFTALSSNSSGLCLVGDPGNFQGTGPWNWTCTVTGQTTPTNCSANIKTWNITPSAGPGGTISPNTQPTTVNNGQTKLFTVTPNSGYTATVGGTCGGFPPTGTTQFIYTTNAITADCLVSATFTLTPVDGRCGSSNGGTFASAPTTNLCSDNSLPTVSGAGPWTWSCAGTNGGQPASCSANKSTGTVDLTFTTSYGSVYGITTSGCTTNGAPCTAGFQIINNGTASAGSFNVQVWISADGYIDGSAQLIGTWSASGLGPGQTTTGSVTGTFNNLPGHNYYYMVIWINPDNKVVETNTLNDIYKWYGIFIYR